jgi:phospholipase/carboxylesterase
MMYLPCIETEPAEMKQANASIIWLHGLGASGDDFAPVSSQLKLDESIDMRFIFPHAPMRSITHNGGMKMPAWYDFVISGSDREVNTDHLSQITQQIADLIQREIDRGVASNRIIIAGFSQGGAIAYKVAMSFEHKLAGLMALSTYVPEENTIKQSQVHSDFPIHIFHGSEDQVVPELLGIKAKELLEEKGYQPEYSQYAMEHTVCLTQIRDIAAFINKCLA